MFQYLHLGCLRSLYLYSKCLLVNISSWSLIFPPVVAILHNLSLFLTISHYFSPLLTIFAPLFHHSTKPPRSAQSDSQDQTGLVLIVRFVSSNPFSFFFSGFFSFSSFISPVFVFYVTWSFCRYYSSSFRSPHCYSTVSLSISPAHLIPFQRHLTCYRFSEVYTLATTSDSAQIILVTRSYKAIPAKTLIQTIQTFGWSHRQSY